VRRKKRRAKSRETAQAEDDGKGAAPRITTKETKYGKTKEENTKRKHKLQRESTTKMLADGP